MGQALQTAAAPCLQRTNLLRDRIISIYDFYYTACHLVCTGKKSKFARNFTALYVDDESGYSAFLCLIAGGRRNKKD